MTKFLRRGVPVCAAALVVVAAIAATSASGSVQQCSAQHLSAKMTLIKGSFGAGNVSYKLSVKNNGPGSCIMSTYPGLKLVSATGKALPTRVKPTQKAKTNVIPAGQTATAKLRFSPDIPGPGEPTHGACEPKAAKIVVSLNPTTVRGPINPPTSVCQKGLMTMTPLG